jgi:hypothetical protein
MQSEDGMAEITVEVKIEVDDKIAQFVQSYAMLNDIEVGTAFAQFMNMGLLKGAKSLGKAVELGVGKGGGLSAKKEVAPKVAKPVEAPRPAPEPAPAPAREPEVYQEEEEIAPPKKQRVSDVAADIAAMIEEKNRASRVEEPQREAPRRPETIAGYHADDDEEETAPPKKAVYNPSPKEPEKRVVVVTADEDMNPSQRAAQAVRQMKYEDDDEETVKTPPNYPGSRSAHSNQGRFYNDEKADEKPKEDDADKSNAAKVHQAQKLADMMKSLRGY